MDSTYTAIMGEPPIKFVEEDPDLKPTSKGLDLSHIPALPDALLKDGIGLQMFLKLGESAGNRLPSQTVGETIGPAIMPYGSALKMFGKLGNVTSADAEQMTELKHLVESGVPRSKPLLTEDEQWELLKISKYGDHVALLTQQYVKLVAEKEAREAEEQKEKADGGKEMPSQPQSQINDDGWPAVEYLDFAGFTNWIVRCEEVQPNFKEFVKSWARERDARKIAICEAIAKYNPLEDNDEDSDEEGAVNDPDPRQYYSDDVDILALDMANLGK